MSERKAKLGAAPGTLVFLGQQIRDDVRVERIVYDATQIEESSGQKIEPWPDYRDDQTCWLNIDGLHDVEVIRAIGGRLQVSDLVLEDILSLDQRAKFELSGDFAFVIVRMLMVRDDAPYADEQVSLLWNQNTVVSFQQWDEDVFEPVRERLRSGGKRIRRNGAPYLAYALLDTIVDHYFLVAERIAAMVDELEEDLLQGGGSDAPERIHSLHRATIDLARIVVPFREAVSTMRKTDTPVVPEYLTPYLNDLYDHIARIGDAVNSVRERALGLMQLHQANLSNRLNEIMKVLTIVGAVFMPMTFVAGIYGMNFTHMPELQLRWGYPVVLAVMAVVGLGMLTLFKRRGWL